MRELLLYLVKQLTTRPDDVQVESSEESETLRLRLTVSEEDKGRVIGKQGKVIKAIRSVVSAAAAREGKKAAVEVF